LLRWFEVVKAVVNFYLRDQPSILQEYVCSSLSCVGRQQKRDPIKEVTVCLADEVLIASQNRVIECNLLQGKLHVNEDQGLSAKT
jgi:hypothetical protein